MPAGERLRKLRESRGLSAAQLAARVGRSESAVRNQENETNGIPAKLAGEYAAILGSTAAFILYGDPAQPPPVSHELMTLPIRDRVQAGAWLQADYGLEERREHPAARDPRFPTAQQWLCEVVGDSMNALGIFEGDLVHVVDLIDSGWMPRTGDIVEVERLRFQGRERELTIKQAEITPAGTVLLWPRSTNPIWQTPIGLSPPDGDREDTEIRIRGLVVASIRRF